MAETENQKPLDGGPVDSGAENTVSDLDKLKQQLDFANREAQKYQKEAKNAFKLRDTMQAELDSLKSKNISPGDEETRSLITKLQSDIKERDARLAEIQANQAKQGKLAALRSELAKQGFKERYMDKIEHFIDLNRVDPDEPISATVVVDSFKNSWADLFETAPESTAKAKQGLADAAWGSKPKFSSEMTVDDYQKQYEDACRKKEYSKAQEILNKIDKLTGRP